MLVIGKYGMRAFRQHSSRITYAASSIECSSCGFIVLGLRLVFHILPAMEFVLRCNELKCRAQLHDRAVVTTCR